jgi:hypothetical protein
MLGQNGKTELETDTDLFKDMPLTEPKSCRVFFCGQEYAGKDLSLEITMSTLV